MSLKPKSVAMWAAVPLLAINLIACGDDEEVPNVPPQPGLNCGNGTKDAGEDCDDGNLNPQDGCTTFCTTATCGDGVVRRSPANMAEQCDDGNGVDNDSCSNDCEAPSCGNDKVETGEACDGGANCTDDCKLTTCGDGEVQAPEECDDGNARDNDACTTKCLEADCGDGIVQGTEECDQGSNNSDLGACTSDCKEPECGDGLLWAGHELCDPEAEGAPAKCTDECTLESCGNGVVETGELCDDGNQNDADGCTRLCLPATCGDGVKQATEECDDGNQNNADDCLNTCLAPTCGDGILHSQGSGREICDQGEDNGPFPAVCSEACTLTNCGNGELDPGEECDDGDDNGETTSCLPSCQWNVCGDGFAYLTENEGTTNTADLEECDDDNTDDSDACTQECKWNACGDGHHYTKGYDAAYDGDSDEDGNPVDDNPYDTEPCDDGNTSNNDACTRTLVTPGEDGPEPYYECHWNVCGDGQVYSTKTAGDGNPFPAEECDDANDANGDSCLDTCMWNSCEDGWLYTSVTQAGNPNDVEACDDGNSSTTDACAADCQPADCGDGFVWHGREECDHNATGSLCDPADDCVLPDDVCGNGDLDPGETCDDGNDNDNDSCLSTCQWNACGDGFRYMAVTEPGNTSPIEQCDDGNGLNRDACTPGCVWNSCGDGNPFTEAAPVDCPAGILDEFLCDLDEDGPGCDQDDSNPMNECGPPNEMEDCDDGNAVDTDSCLTSCSFNECGDGAQYTTLSDRRNNEPLEACDDGVASATCTDSCTVVRCGDGIISDEAGENCDPEAAPWEADDGEGCGNDCVVDTCGNGDLDAFEDCDDGNTINEDGCTNNCFYPRCGDGIVQTGEGEECDDGNTDPTDTCTNACETAHCNDGIRQGDEECDAGDASPTINGVLNDDGYADHDGFCSDTCEVQCFPNPSLPWAIEYDEETCIFVPEPIGATDDLEYDDLLICDCTTGADVRPDAEGNCDCADESTPDPEVDYLGFVAANRYCQSLGIGANLVTIDSTAKNAAVVNMINAIGPGYDYDLDEDIEFPETDNAYWIGLYDDHTTQRDPPGRWTWVADGSLVPNALGAELWEAGEPNDADGDINTPGQEDCGVLQGDDTDEIGAAQPGRWNDVTCESQFRFVCEFPLAQAP